MKRSLLCVSMAIVISVIAVGCSDGQLSQAGTAAPPTGSAVAATVVSRSDLIAALWSAAEMTPAEAPAEEPAGDEATAASDAGCLAASSFGVEGTTGFMIQTNPAPTETNTTPVVIVSSINLVVTDGGNRSALCGTGEKSYIVTASAEFPIDIELSPEASAQESLESIAQDGPTPYPDTCRIQAHFERHGGEPCDAASADQSPEEAPAVAEEQPPASEDADSQTPAAAGPNVSLNREEGAPAPQPGAEETPAEEEPPASEESCSGPAMQTFKLVVESVDCDSTTSVEQPGT